MSKHINYRTGNPALTEKSFILETNKSLNSSELMTLEGTVNKAIYSISLVLIFAVIGFRNFESLVSLLMPFALVGLIIALVTCFKKHLAPITTPFYAIIQGLVLGVISANFEKFYDGIILQAMSITFSIFFALLFLYKTKLIKASENFKLVVFAATGGIFLLYLVNITLSFFGMNLALLEPTNSSLMSIGLSLFIVIIAALNLVIDFDFIEVGVENGAPRYMEWYGAFGLLVTLIWLYLEVLRLLAKFRSR